MTAPENPERLLAALFVDEDGERYMAVIAPDASGRGHDPSTDAPVQAYVREDVAAAREALS